MIINNICTEIGDILYLEFQIPIIGLISLSSYTDTIIGETADRYFTKEFKYSLDGFNFSNWIVLSNLELSQIQIEATDFFYIKYKYIRSGLDNTGNLSFIDIELIGTFQPISCGEIFNHSIFADFINCPDSEVLNWCTNVTEKCYYEGIIPNYIIRRVNQENNEDKDYLDFWRSIACFFAMIVIYGRKILENFRNYENLLKLYLEQKNIFFNNKISLEDLNYLVENYYDEIRQRGTSQIYKEKTSTQLITTSISSTQSQFIKKINGELLRLIGYTKLDEFIFNLVKKESIGWTMNKSSPLYKGLSSQSTINKAYEDGENILDLSKYPLFNPQFISIEDDNLENKSVLKILNVEPQLSSGIGPSHYPDFNEEDLNKVIRVNENLDYQITFWLKVPTFDDSDSDSTSDSWVGNYLDTQITFGVLGLDEDNNKIDFIDIRNGGPKNHFFIQQKLLQGDLYYFVRGIIYNKNHSLLNSEEATLNIGFGFNLKFAPKIIKIIPYMLSVRPHQLTNFIPNCLYIRDLKIKPLNTPFSTGFIQIKNFIEIFLENNNNSLTQEEISNIMKKYLLPYNCTFKNIWLGDNYDFSSSSSSL